jgi:hypothetical protein
VGAILAELSVHLAAMRAGADVITRQPAQRRSASTGTAVIGQMVALPSLLFLAEEKVLADISAADPTVAPLLTATHSASDLRLHG